MKLKFLNKSISFILIFTLITGLFPPFLFSQPGPSPFSEVKGFNNSVFENHFSRADREINPDRWMSEARFGITQAICAWELTAEKLYDNPDELNTAKNKLEKWSEEELEKRFSQWLIGRFFGKAAEDVFLELVNSFGETQKKYSWHLDDEGNIIFDAQTGNPLVIRPSDEDREFFHDLILWRGETDNILKTTNASYNSVIINISPELLAYIPLDLRETMSGVISETINLQSISLKNEFENIAAREERIFSSRRTRDIWSLRNKSENEAARIFTNKLITETEETCKQGIEELNTRIEQAQTDAGDLAILGEEWLRLYQEQFERGLKAWEEAEERFFIRRIEWEQDSFNLFSRGEETWFAAFNKFEEERNNWEISAGKLFDAGWKMFSDISEDFTKSITDAKEEFKLNAEMRIGEGKTKVKALIDMYLLCSSAALSALENYKFWESKNNTAEMEKSNSSYISYLEKASEARQNIFDNYGELFGTGTLKDVLSPDAVSDDFYLDDYQIALIKSRALVLYWERKTEIANSIMTYASELTAGRITETEGLLAWEEAKEAYNNSLLDYETEFKKLNDIGANIQLQIKKLNNLAEKMKTEEEILDKLTNEYSALVSLSIGSQEEYYLKNFNNIYKTLVKDYISFAKTGADAKYIKILEYGKQWDIAEKQFTANEILNILINGGGDLPSLAEVENNASKDSDSLINLKIRLASIDFLSGSLSSSADWYSKIKGLILTEEERADIFGEKLIARLVEDYNSISLLLNEKLSEYDLIDSADYLAQYYEEYYFCEGLLILYSNLSQTCSFLQEEIWQDNLNSLTSFLNDYGIEQIGAAVLNIENISEAIYEKSGNFIHNASLFIIDFENIFTNIHHWLEYEINCWKDSFISYLAAYALSKNIKPVKNSAKLSSEYEEIWAECLLLADTGQIDNTLIEKVKNMNILNYMLQITESWEAYNSRCLSGKENHWREYLLDEYLTEKDDSINLVSSLNEGILADALYYAKYFTNRINDSFIINSNKNTIIEHSVQYYYNFYSNEVVKAIVNFNSLNAHYNEFSNAYKTYENSKLTPEEITNELTQLNEKLIEQEEKYNLAKGKYSEEAVTFSNLGSNYDGQYKYLNQLYDKTEQKRFEYEIQDAIQRWASTSYLNTDNIDLENTKNKLLKARTVFNVLSDIFSGNSASPSGDPEYETLFTAYKQSINAKMKTLETVDLLSSEIFNEYTNNQTLYSNYQSSLNQLGSPDQSMFDHITVKDGRLAFAKNESNKEALDNFFSAANDSLNEPYKISLYEDSLRNLSQSMTKYFEDPEKFMQWSLARDYLLLSLIDTDDELCPFKKYYTGIDDYKEDGSIGKLTVKTGINIFKKTEIKVYEYLNSIGRFASYSSLCEETWTNLSEEEKKDLEYYVILTLSNSNNYSAGFGKLYAYETCINVGNYVRDNLIIRSEGIVFGISNTIQDIHKLVEINSNTLENIYPVCFELENQVNNWTAKLKQTLSLIETNKKPYQDSCEKINLLENRKSGNEYIKWEDIKNSLSVSSKMPDEDITKIKTYWDAMQKSSNDKFNSVSMALVSLLNWTEKEEENNKNALEKYWLDAVQTQKMNENIFHNAAEKYILGLINLDELKKAADKAYFKNVVTSKQHLNNMHAVVLESLLLYENKKTNFNYIFSAIGSELIAITEKTIKDRYNAELSAREAEWNQQLAGLADKLMEWQKSAVQIIENGRNDWNAGLQKLETAYMRWYANFKNEYDRVSGEWSLAYLAGLEDKEIWLEQAANAFYQASSESLLSLIGTEGERLSRFIDTREPISVSVDTDQAQSIITDLLRSSGIVNMSYALGSINNIANASSPLVRRGVGGISVWDAALVKTEASDLARKANKEIADEEAKKLAYNARLHAEEAVKNLTENVETANDKFRENIDNAFIFNGLWNKSGNDYVKNVLKGSTLFDPVITTSVTIKGYADYIMEDITLKTNINETHLRSLDSIAINALLKNVYAELEEIAYEIFKDDEDSPGKFTSHIGKSPETKPNDEITKKRSDIFVHEGTGELGRMMSDFIYWSVIECYGSAELNTADWDKRMWDDEGSWFEAPSLRTVGTIACSIIAGIVSAGTLGLTAIALSVAISSSSEYVFTVLDVAQGYKTYDEGAFHFGKTLLINTATSLASGLFSGIDGAANIFSTGLTQTATTAATGAISTVAAQTIMTGLQTITVGLTTSLLNGITYSSEEGFGYSSEILVAGIKGMLTNAATAMTATLVSSSLTALNSGVDMSKLTGYNKLNKTDIQNLNNLVGSLASQGINYALGNDFTLNVLNLGLFTNNAHNSGLLELHLGRDGVSMNIGTGGANVSIDNLISSVRGAMVWNVNTQIDKYIKNQSGEDGNNFNSHIALRAQYGYGDTVQVGQLWDILNGRTLLNTDADGEYAAETTRNNDENKVINLTGYAQNMSVEDQMRLAILLGHEAYRDGYTTNDNYLETQSATLAHTQMAIRMIMGKENLNIDTNLGRDIEEYLKAIQNKDMSSFNAYVDANYDSSADYWKLVLDQDNVARFEWDGEYSFDLTAMGISDRMDQLDNQTMWTIYNMSENELSFDDFKNAVGKFDTLNSVMINFEKALNVDPINTMSINSFKEHQSLFFNALRDVGSSGLLAEKAANVLPLIEESNVFANGGGALTGYFGWRIINENFQWHNAWDLGARGDSRLVAPMSGTLSLSFTEKLGLQLITSGENNESITYSHSDASSIKYFVELYTTNGVNMNDEYQLTGIQNKMIIGVMGNTGTLSQLPHVDIIYKQGILEQDPALFFYRNGNNVSYPVTDYARFMTGLSKEINKANISLSNNQISNIYNFLNTDDGKNATVNFINIGAKSNNYYQFVQTLILQQLRSTP
ncbi:MAG: hypothetical protein FWB77_01125 [Treponema sp.]|nr:hypothetical protein [Treponema sp.]